MRLIACFAFLILVCTSAFAQTADARKRIYPTQDGFLEVDLRTGAINECKRSDDGYRCMRVTEGDALLKEDTEPRTQTPAAPRQAPGSAPRSTTPTEEELDRALDVMERFLRRFMGIIREGRSDRT